MPIKSKGNEGKIAKEGSKAKKASDKAPKPNYISLWFQSWSNQLLKKLESLDLGFSSTRKINPKTDAQRFLKSIFVRRYSVATQT